MTWASSPINFCVEWLQPCRTLCGGRLTILVFSSLLFSLFFFFAFFFFCQCVFDFQVWLLHLSSVFPTGFIQPYQETEGHTPQEVEKGHVVYFFKYIAFHGSGSSSPSAFTSLYALPEYTSLTTYGPSQLGRNLPLMCGSCD